MSTLEKAYLKSIGENESSDEVDALLKSDSDLTPTIPKKKETREIVSSRNGISRMSAMERYSPQELEERRLIHANMKDSILLDRYRNLRTKLLAISGKSNFVTLVTSAVPDEDSALVAANLAATFALDEAKTSILIEANIQDPTLNSVFDFEDQKGLIDYLESEELDSGDVLNKTRLNRLRYLPSGLPRENSAEYFTSDKMQALIAELGERYPDRFPIINAPSIINSADARILVDLCDLVVLVVPYGRCTEEEIVQASLAIGENKLAGIVLNHF